MTGLMTVLMTGLRSFGGYSGRSMGPGPSTLNITLWWLIPEQAGKRPKSWPLPYAGCNREGDYHPVEGVQIFTPTPMTRSTCMYHTGKDPITGESVFVPRTFTEKKEQKKMLESPHSEKSPSPVKPNQRQQQPRNRATSQSPRHTQDPLNLAKWS